MGKGSFRALVVTGLLVPVLAVVAVLVHPRGNALIKAFLSPVPTASSSGPRSARDGGTTLLPAMGGLTGAESVELRTLREDSAGALGRPPRRALFALDAEGAVPTSAGRYVRPSGLRRPEIMVRDDPSVDQAVQHLTGDDRARSTLVDALRRSGRMTADLGRIFRAWKLPEAMTALMFVESGAVPTASSDGGAVGLWQLTPDVAHVYGLAMLPSYDERRGVATSTEAAARYVTDLRERFGSWELAILAFGFGYKPTLDEVARHEARDYWDMAGSLPQAMTTYVSQVLATAVVLTNLDRFGLDTVKRDEPVTLSDLAVPAGTSLLLVARAAGLPPADLRELNPEYASDLVPSASFPLVVHVPSGRLARARDFLPAMQSGAMPLDDAGLGAGEPDAAAQPVISRGVEKRMFYRVSEGDTLPALSAQHGVPLETLASDNALDPSSSLSPGMILAIRVVELDAGAASPLKSPKFPKSNPLQR